MPPLEAAKSLVLLEFKASYGLGFISPTGRIVTSYHVVVDEPEIIAHLHDGRTVPVTSVSGIDLKRDLAVLEVALKASELRELMVAAVGERLAAEGTLCSVFGMVPNEDRARWVDARIESVQVVAASLSVYVLGGAVPADASGSPLVGPDGSILGVVTVAETDTGVITLAVPWRYVAPLVGQRGDLPLHALVAQGQRPPKRQVPQHPLALLNGSAMSGLEATSAMLNGAIRQGAPAYNEGNVKRCFELYAQTARQLIDARDDCPGVQQALQAGLDRAMGLKSVDHQAWAMRDAFDGLLAVIEKFLRAFPSGASRNKSSKPTFLN